MAFSDKRDGGRRMEVLDDVKDCSWRRNFSPSPVYALGLIAVAIFIRAHQTTQSRVPS